MAGNRRHAGGIASAVQNFNRIQQAAAPRRATDEEVLAWAKRHDLSCWDHLTEARAAFEDAQTLHLTDGVTTCPPMDSYIVAQQGPQPGIGALTPDGVPAVDDQPEVDKPL